MQKATQTLMDRAHDAYVENKSEFAELTSTIEAAHKLIANRAGFLKNESVLNQCIITERENVILSANLAAEAVVVAEELLTAAKGVSAAVKRREELRREIEFYDEHNGPKSSVSDLRDPPAELSEADEKARSNNFDDHAAV